MKKLISIFFVLGLTITGIACNRSDKGHDTQDLQREEEIHRDKVIEDSNYKRDVLPHPSNEDSHLDRRLEN